MARAYFKCAECGVDVAVHDRNRSSVDSLAEWHESNGHLCGDCQQKQRFVEGSQAAEANQADGLAALIGSEKQVAWAETLRSKMLPGIKSLIPISHAWLVKIEAGDYRKPASDEQIAKARREIRRNLLGVDVILGQLRASWWIDHRGAPVELMLADLKSEIDQAEAALCVEPATPAEAEIQHAAQSEALILPAGDPVSSQVAEIGHAADGLRVTFVEKREDFRLLMRAAGFEWHAPHWERRLPWMAGEPADRMAELAHRLVAAGFMVRLHDEVARAKAIAGDFAPEQRRWISKNVGGDFVGWLKIVWPKDDDLYAPAKRLLGARYKAGAVHVPPGSIEEVVDFAERYGFSVSPGAAEIAAAHRSALAAGAVIADPKQGPSPLCVPEGAPEKLEPVVGDIDPDLRDEG